jgi:hypothetical protein
MEPQPGRSWWRIGCAAVLGVVAVFAVGLVLGWSAGGPVAPVTALEHRIVITQARNEIFEHPFQRLTQLSYRVERIPDPEPGPCEDDLLTEAAGGSEDVAWHVTAYGLFGVTAGGTTITCGVSTRD